jgi:heat shock protein HslJ
MRGGARTRTVAIVTLVPVLLLAACNDDEGSAASLEGPTWTLESFAVGGGQQPVPEGVEATVTFADGTVQGNSGCNSFSGSYEVSGDRLTFGPLASTMMACESPQSDVEAVVLSALEATASFGIQDGTLTLFDEADADLLAYAEASS